MNGREKSYQERRKEIFRRQRARQRRETIMKLVMGFLSLIVIVSLTIGVFSVQGKAQSKKGQQYKYYTSVQIKYGDTLWSLADQYADDEHYDHFSYVAEVKSINHIHDFVCPLHLSFHFTLIDCHTIVSVRRYVELTLVFLYRFISVRANM